MKILITGATGYIGRRLAYKALDEGFSVRLFVRNTRKVDTELQKKCEIIQGSTFEKENLDRALSGIDTAYYLIHSMGKGSDFEALDKKSAENFRNAAVRNSVAKIVYLGGLGEQSNTSRHLRSRNETGRILSSDPGKIDVICFRAGVIIGSGSASFEIVRNITEKLPLMVAPRWVETLTEPVGIQDVIKYLISAADSDLKGSHVVDIGTGKMSFKEMMLKAAEVMHLKRIIIKVPLLTPNLSSYWLILFTPVNFDVAKELIEGLKFPSVKENDKASQLFPEIQPESYEKAFTKALEEIYDNQVISSWCDSSGGRHCDVPFVNEISKAVYKDMHIAEVDNFEAEKVFGSVKMLGGKRGWLAYDILWQLRGLMDKLIGGYGLNRGRRNEKELRVGDYIDFWKVVDLVENKRLLLQAQMKVPGKAWLEFSLIDNTLVQTAFFYPKGLMGRLYWFSMLPFHKFIFGKMLHRVVKRAEKQVL
ncbi:SDR family oxidoreductase [Flexistipes sp.]|uniref:SDR family oxidoreductase n=1 Tax=Flexistipes sp. TaxID=3088135 RepID=UPI002E240CB5|nr:SDR family oxidoreductase [Flexistipes sp.]